MPQEWSVSRERRGYPAWLTQAAERCKLLVVGSNIIYRRVTSSTNDDARSLAILGAPDGLVVVADEQTHGRGRFGRRWLAPAGSSLLVSVLFRHTIPVRLASRLSMLVALAAVDAVAAVTGLDATLKWPNDILLGEEKLGGILAEINSEKDILSWAVVGLGINVNNDFDDHPELAQTATSLKKSLGYEVDRGDVLAAFLRCLSTRYVRFQHGDDPFQEWQGKLSTLGKQVTVSTGEETIRGLAEFTSPEGSLFLLLEDGSRREVLAGDVTLAKDGK